MINDREGGRFDIPIENSPHVPTDSRNVEQNETSSNIQKNYDFDGDNGNIPTQGDLSLSYYINSVHPDSSRLSNDGGHSDVKISDNDEAGVCHDEEDSNSLIEVGSLEKNQNRHSVHLTNRATHQPPIVHSHHEDVRTNLNSTEQDDLNRAYDVSCSELHQSNFRDINDSTPNGTSKHVSSLSVANEYNLPTSHEEKYPNSYASNGHILDEMEDDSFNRVIESAENRTPAEDSTKFLSALYGDLRVSSELSQISKTNTSECIGSTDYGTISFGDSGMKFNQVDAERTSYDPSAWTPMEIETATGCADSTFVKSPLKLRSTYSEVEVNHYLFSMFILLPSRTAFNIWKY